MARSAHIATTPLTRKVLSLALSLALVAAFIPLQAKTAFAESQEGGANATAVADGSSATSGQETDGVLLALDDGPEAGISLLSAGKDYGTLSDAGLVVTEQVATADNTIILAAQPTQGQSVDEAVAAAEELPGVAYAQPNYVYHLVDGAIEEADDASDSADDGAASASSPVAKSAEELSALATPLVNDPFAQNESSTQARNQYWLYNSNIDDAWESSTCQGNVTVAMLDSGIMLDHEDLAANVLDSLAWDAYYQKALDTTANLGGDSSGHGTHASGIVAGVANNGVGLAGASYNANILPIKVFDDTSGSGMKSSTVALIRAYDYVLSLVDVGAASNVRVINMSLGSYNDTLSDPKKVDGVDRLLEDCIKTAKYDYGIVTVCAGGNGNSATTPRTDKIYPADFKDCVSVTALEPDDTNIVWSDYNAFKDISAPGRSIWSAQATSTGETSLYMARSGTSMASPIVAGVFALLFAAAPDATVDQACEAVYLSATPVSDPGNDRTQTSGSHGAINAKAALDYLMSGKPKDFSDTAEDAWFYQSIYYATSHGIMNGYGSFFDPESPLTREQAACVLYNYLGNSEIAPAAPQPDVEQGIWYSEAVNWCVANGVMNGFANTGLFGVGTSITREQLACVIANAAHADTASANPSAFNALWDHDLTSTYAIPSLTWAVDNGVINGIDDGTHKSRTLAPQDNVTRAQMAAIMMNTIEGGLLS